MFESCLPWMVGTHVMGRLIAQLVCHSVLPECSGDGDGVDGVDGTHLGALFLFLRDNPDMVRPPGSFCGLWWVPAVAGR